MKNFHALLIALLIASCNQPSTNTTGASPMNMDSLRTEVLNADKAWNAASLQKGYYHSRIDFVADDGMELESGDMPLIGKQAITDYAATHADSTQTSQWMATRAEVAASGDLGYTYGSYAVQMKTKAGKDTTAYGSYVTVWKKQSDGSWKFLADASVPSPQQVK